MIDDAFIKQLELIVRQSGKILLSYFRKTLKVEKKEDLSQVTEADFASEKFLLEALHKLMPQASFWAEESGQSGEGDYSWVIDPLDGTTNFVQGLSHFCVSVALAYKNIPVVGMIYQPVLDELFYARKSKGAFLNGNSIQIRSFREMNECVVGVASPFIPIIQPHVYAARLFGASALDQAYLACGRLDGLLFTNLGWWDVAAGIVIIGESGGKVTDFTHKPIQPGYKAFVAANDSLHKQLINLLK